jgi:hypothetical protein
MPVLREFWSAEFSEKGHPGWPCPTCGTGSLRIKADTLAKAETSDSYLNEREGHIKTYKARFACLFECGSSECGEPVAVSGTVRLEELSNHSLEERFIPQGFLPAPQMIRVPASCPDVIRDEVQASFALFWLDHSSSLNRIRNAIELLLTEMGVKRHGRKSGGGRTRLSLDLVHEEGGEVRIGRRVLRVRHAGLGRGRGHIALPAGPCPSHCSPIPPTHLSSTTSASFCGPVGNVVPRNSEFRLRTAVSGALVADR